MKTFHAPSLFLTLAIAASAHAQSGPSVCASILMGEDKVACMRAIAGHWVEAGAAGVCAAVLMADDKTACLRASLDKRYSTEELATCRGILMGEDKAACMAAAGSSSRRDDQEDQPKGRRRARRGDDDDRGDQRPRRGPPTRWARLTNFSRETVVRLSWRRLDDSRFHEVVLQGPVRTNQMTEVVVPDEALEVCVETSRSLSLSWAVVRRDQNVEIPASERNWSDSDCGELP